MTSIVLAVDQNYLPYVDSTIAQLARFGRRADGIALVVPASVAEEALDHPRSVAVAHDIALEVVAISEITHLFDQGLLVDNGYISHFTYAKLMLAETLPHLDEVLYLDVDTVIRAPLDALLDWDLRHPLAAVEELVQNSRRLFGTSRTPYFNAGVLRLSMERLRRDRVWGQAQELLRKRPEMRFQDQDVLNLIFQGRFDILPGTYNVFDSLATSNRNLWAMRDPAIVHFAGPVKPWQSAADSRFAHEWRRYYAEAVRSVGLSGTEFEGSGRSEVGVPPSRVVSRVLPPQARKVAKSVGLRALDHTMGRLERTKTALELGPRWRANLAITMESALPEMPAQNSAAPAGDEARRLDLLVSVPNSGAETLAAVINGIPPFTPDADAQRSASGRELKTVFADDMNPQDFEELLRDQRPRLLILRREMIFTCPTLSEWEAADHVVRCDAWFDRVLASAGRLQLVWLSLTYDGLFGSGADVPLLETMYPAAAQRLNAAGLRTAAGEHDNDRLRDARALATMTALTALSTATQKGLLRLPGQHFPDRDPAR